MNMNDKQHRSILQIIAHRAMIERGLLPDFSAAALAELGRLPVPALTDDETVRDLRDLLWASIDNDDSRDLDQLTVAEAVRGDNIKILVAIADVDSFVKNESAIDEHALLLESRIGEQFDSIVTGAAAKGTWVRLLTMPVEGKLVDGFEGIDVGDLIRVQLTFIDVQRGFIDFRRINSAIH